MIDLTNYKIGKTKGLLTLSRITLTDFAVATRKFDPNEGTELSRQVVGGNIKELQDRKLELQKQIDEIDAFMKDFNALVPQN